jgi:hypothetical protein
MATAGSCRFSESIRSTKETTVRVAFIVWLVLSTSASAQGPDSRLTVGDVEKITGLTGVHVVAPGSQPGAGPGLNFAGPDNKLILMVNFGTDALYRRAREQKEMAMGNTKVPMVLYHAGVPGIGDEAFDSPPGPVQYVIYLRKGTKAASVTTYFDASGKKTRLSMEQLKTIAKTVADRL